MVPARFTTPWKQRAEKFIARHREHPGVRSALGYIAERAAEGRPRLSGFGKGKLVPKAILASECWYRIRIGGISPEKVLASIVGVQAAGMVNHGLFLNDDHERMLMARRVIALAPYRTASPTISKPSKRALLGLCTDLEPVGLLARRIAEALVARFPPDPSGLATPVPGSTVPFDLPKV
jgi:hypothetical protein